MWDSLHTHKYHTINQIGESQTLYGLKDTTHKVGPNEDVRDLSGGDCDAPI